MGGVGGVGGVRGVRKENLPTKVCATCGRLFTWRKKWERDWDNVRYCSDRCRANKGAATGVHKGGRDAPD